MIWVNKTQLTLGTAEYTQIGRYLLNHAFRVRVERTHEIRRVVFLEPFAPNGVFRVVLVYAPASGAGEQLNNRDAFYVH